MDYRPRFRKNKLYHKILKDINYQIFLNMTRSSWIFLNPQQTNISWRYWFISKIIWGDCKGLIWIYLCLLSLNHIRSNDFKSICMLIIWVQGFLNWIETLLLFYLEIFMWLNEFLPIIETLLWLKVFTLTKINRDFTLIN